MAAFLKMALKPVCNGNCGGDMTNPQKYHKTFLKNDFGGLVVGVQICLIIRLLVISIWVRSMGW